MNNVGIGNGIKKGIAFFREHTPVILEGIACFSTVAAVIFTAKATPLALQNIKNAEEKKGSKLTTEEKVFAAWKPYAIPAALTCVALGSSIGATKTALKHGEVAAAALYSAYSASEMAAKKFKEKTEEVVGEKKTAEIEAAAASEEAIQASKKLDKASIIETGHGNNLYYDSFNGRFFRSNRDFIEKCAIDIQRRINGGEEMISLNELWQNMGLPVTDSSEGFGFNSDHLPEFYFYYHDEVFGEECATVKFAGDGMPKYQYYRLY